MEVLKDKKNKDYDIKQRYEQSALGHQGFQKKDLPNSENIS